MKLQMSADDLRPIVQQVVAEVLDQAEADRARLDGRLAYPEPEAAALLGVAPHVLRDCRRRGELTGRKAGKRILYTRDELVRFLGDSNGRGQRGGQS